MSTGSVDNTPDLFSAIDQTEAARERRDRANKQDGVTDPSNPAASTLETRFSNMLRGRLTSNIVFTRVNQQLDLPQRIISDRKQAPIVDTRDDRPQDDVSDSRDATGYVEQPREVEQQPKQYASHDAARSTNANPAADASDVGAQAAGKADAGAAAATAQTAGQQDGSATKTGQAAHANQAAANAAHKAAVSQTLPQQEASPELLEQAKQAASKAGPKLTATVTQEAPQIASQPQTSLSAKAAVDAAALAKKGDPGQAQLAAQAEGDAQAEAEDSANNIFNRIKANGGSNAGKHGAEAKAAEATDPGKIGTPPAQAAPGPAPQAAPGLQRALGAGGQVSSLTGTTQSGVTTDATSGGPASLGQNNSIQSRSAPPPTAQASRPPPVPTHVVAEQVAVNIQRGLAQGQDRITVQLRPHELGRVEIKMEMTHDGKMTAVVSAERPETLDMLRQDSRSLLQSLADAGITADESGLSFQLQGQNAGDGGNQSASGPKIAPVAESLEDLIDTGFVFEESGGFADDGRLDVRI